MTRAPSGAERIEILLAPAGAAYAILKPIVEFLSHPMDVVTGDPDALNAQAKAWRDAATRMDQFARTRWAPGPTCSPTGRVWRPSRSTPR